MDLVVECERKDTCWLKYVHEWVTWEMARTVMHLDLKEDFGVYSRGLMTTQDPLSKNSPELRRSLLHGVQYTLDLLDKVEWWDIAFSGDPNSSDLEVTFHGKGHPSYSSIRAVQYFNFRNANWSPVITRWVHHRHISVLERVATRRARSV